MVVPNSQIASLPQYRRTADPRVVEAHRSEVQNVLCSVRVRGFSRILDIKSVDAVKAQNDRIQLFAYKRAVSRKVWRWFELTSGILPGEVSLRQRLLCCGAREAEAGCLILISSNLEIQTESFAPAEKYLGPSFVVWRKKKEEGEKSGSFRVEWETDFTPSHETRDPELGYRTGSLTVRIQLKSETVGAVSSCLDGGTGRPLRC